MASLPTGTVTFLFTDIEESTRLLETLGDRYAEVLGESRQFLRTARKEQNRRQYAVACCLQITQLLFVKSIYLRAGRCHRGHWRTSPRDCRPSTTSTSTHRR